jgi:hypothetical protein
MPQLHISLHLDLARVALILSLFYSSVNPSFQKIRKQYVPKMFIRQNITNSLIETYHNTNQKGGDGQRKMKKNQIKSRQTYHDTKKNKKQNRPAKKERRTAKQTKKIGRKSRPREVKKKNGKKYYNPYYYY